MELDVLLAPLAGDAPAGADLSFSLDYDAIRDARRADDPTLAQGEWVTELKTADWPQVARRCGELLGAHMVGAEVTELIQGYVIGRSLETTEEDLMNTVFPHPTLSEMMHESVLDAYGRALHF